MVDMAQLPANFSPANYLYLNPELQAYSNVNTIEAAISYYQSNINGSNLLYDTSSIDSRFNSYVYLSSSKDGLDISHLNNVIKLAMSNDGLGPTELSAQSRFIQTISQPVLHNYSNLFSLVDPLYALTSSKLIVGDDVTIVTTGGHDVVCKVTSINSNTSPQQFNVSNYTNYLFTSNQSNLTLLGQRLYDVDRLAKINWLRGYRSSLPNVSYIVDETFNPDLYRLLYPESRGYDNVQALLDYNGYILNPFRRVGSVNDIVRNVDDDFVTLATTKVEWASNSAATSVAKAVWSSNYTGSYLSTYDAQVLYAPSNTTHAQLQWTSNALSNVFRSDGYNITVNSISGLSNTVSTSGNWSFSSNVDVSRILTVGQSVAQQNGNIPMVIDARGGIRADDYILTSDARTKVDIKMIDPKDCCDFIQSTSPVKFTLVRGHAKQEDKIGFIAQQLESITIAGGSFRGANIVRDTYDCVPNIMQRVHIDGNGVVSLDNHGLSIGTNLCFIHEEAHRMFSAKINHVNDINHFTIDLAPIIQVLGNDFQIVKHIMFLFGTFVDDFKVVDQSHLLAVAVGAIKELTHRVQSLESLFVGRI
jgi:hypothetical protein